MNTQVISAKTDTINNFLPFRRELTKSSDAGILAQAASGLRRFWAAFEKSWAASANANSRLMEIREEAHRQSALLGIW